mmetsp:Transcript_14988/g.34581  ORF Transcript_14988/g.34581 Transcript_14988/m.34581 type:complete len:220 (-) Transcript_14988:726-1385(-)
MPHDNLVQGPEVRLLHPLEEPPLLLHHVVTAVKRHVHFLLPPKLHFVQKPYADICFELYVLFRRPPPSFLELPGPLLKLLLPFCRRFDVCGLLPLSLLLCCPQALVALVHVDLEVSNFALKGALLPFHILELIRVGSCSRSHAHIKLVLDLCELCNSLALFADFRLSIRQLPAYRPLPLLQLFDPSVHLILFQLCLAALLLQLRPERLLEKRPFLCHRL